jgi:ABC-type glycerol-3-phosphate transport system substrate-binding protein
MLPFYNYTMALIYRTDIMEDPELQMKYKNQFGKELDVPDTLDEYVQMCIFMNDNTDLYGASMQAARGDSIVMEWSNYLFAMGGDYYDRNWNVIINNDKAIKAIEYYRKNLRDAAPEGALNFFMDDSFRVMAQGQAWSHVTFNFQLAAYNKPERSKVVGKVAIAPMPGEKSLAGAWGWGIAHNTKYKEESWEFLKWVESFDIAKKRALNGGAPTRIDVLRDPDVLNKYPHYSIVETFLTRSKSVPEFTYSTQMVETVGRELSLICAEGKDVHEAMDQAAAELEELARKAKLK